MANEAVRVVCRFRPPKHDDPIPKGSRVITGPDGFLLKYLPDQKTIEFKEGGVGQKEPHKFTYDCIFDFEAKQEAIFEVVAKDIVADILKGYNGTIFAYGQTGSGKTHTMFGPGPGPDVKGIIPRAVEHLFMGIEESEDIVEVTIKCSFLEIYKEGIRDLLNPTGKNLKIRETPTGELYVQNLVDEYCSGVDEIMELIALGEKNRKVASTLMNDTSSRSHSVFIMVVTQKSKDGSVRVGKLNLADLAGSERVRSTGASGETLEEAKKINQSLSALGNCINALTDSKRTHIPFRDSTLTFLLKDSLGGNCKTTLVVCCSPEARNGGETLSTLRFAKRAKQIKNTVYINKQLSVEQLTLIVNGLRKELAAANKKIKQLQGRIQVLEGLSPEERKQAILEGKLAADSELGDGDDSKDVDGDSGGGGGGGGGEDGDPPSRGGEDGEEDGGGGDGGESPRAAAAVAAAAGVPPAGRGEEEKGGDVGDEDAESQVVSPGGPIASGASGGGGGGGAPSIDVAPSGSGGGGGGVVGPSSTPQGESSPGPSPSPGPEGVSRSGGGGGGGSGGGGGGGERGEQPGGEGEEVGEGGEGVGGEGGDVDVVDIDDEEGRVEEDVEAGRAELEEALRRARVQLAMAEEEALELKRKLKRMEEEKLMSPLDQAKRSLEKEIQRPPTSQSRLPEDDVLDKMTKQQLITKLKEASSKNRRLEEKMADMRRTWAAYMDLMLENQPVVAPSGKSRKVVKPVKKGGFFGEKSPQMQELTSLSSPISSPPDHKRAPSSGGPGGPPPSVSRDPSLSGGVGGGGGGGGGGVESPELTRRRTLTAEILRADSSAILYKGVLWKKPTGWFRKSWQKRLVILRKTSLEFYNIDGKEDAQIAAALKTNPVKLELDAAVDLTPQGGGRIIVQRNKEMKNCFDVVTPKGEHNLHADNQEDANIWMENIQLVVDEQSQKGKRQSVSAPGPLPGGGRGVMSPEKSP